MTIIKKIVIGILLGCLSSVYALDFKVDYKEFLANHDMTWDRVPNRWEVAPYTGNGNVGFTFYQAKGAKNVISIHTGRHDYYDHRLPHEGRGNSWIYRCRLPLGRFDLESKGDITSVDLRLDLWDAELVGTVKTSQGSYALHGLTHSESDVIYFETNAAGGESIKITWRPEVPFSSVRKTLDSGGGPKSWKTMRTDPYPLPPEAIFSEEGEMKFCFQPLYQHRGETTTGWKLSGDATGKQLLTASVHHSFPEKNSMDIVKRNLAEAHKSIGEERFISAHQKWWHTYYPQSFLTLNDTEKEGFYWIQMYKLASAMRENGPILDVMGPWYHYTFWPMVWGDLNVQLIYWTHLAANRMSVGESLPNNLDKYAFNLVKNVPSHWEESASIAACFPQDCFAPSGGVPPNMLAWVLNNYWLHCQYAADHDRLRDKFFPLLRKTMNAYLNWIKDTKAPIIDGRLHLAKSWSPEYPAPWDEDCNFTISLLRWTAKTLLDLNSDHGLNDPLAVEWQRILDTLVDYQIDEHGLRIAKNTAFDKPHRHYSHLLGFFPLADLTPENPETAKMLRTSVEHWLKVSRSGIKVGAMPVTGYTATGAASMYAWLGDEKMASYYLEFLVTHKNISPTTMYAEGNPVIETPLSFAKSVHDMLLQSWGGKIRVFNGTPKEWPDAAFHQLRTQGAFLVSAKKKDGVTQFVNVESMAGSPCLIRTDIEKPRIYINGKKAKGSQVKITNDGFYNVALKKGDTAIFSPVTLKSTNLSIEAISVAEDSRNLFGLNDKTTRLPGHQNYYPEKGLLAKLAKPIPMPVSKGRFVRIELPGNERILSLAEVEIYEGGKNVAVKQKATASSAVYGGVPERAVDGNTDGKFGNASVTCTKEPSANPWLEVDLG